MATSKQKKMEKAVDLLKSIAHPVRLSLLCNLLHHGEMSVTALVEAEKGRVSQSHVSQFLSRMRTEGLISNRKDGQIVYYRIKAKEVAYLVNALHGIYCK